ncbi:mitotic spindle assembly checkpoint protein MAD2A [Phycomyces blakesleeanus]|uniref:Mitotic spindle assembly checkpoint protein MAD2A n=1 Tax=Phycomyces blakesleeanus TaxID=4837 RepID=A0ABR3BAC5_PHYBL
MEETLTFSGSASFATDYFESCIYSILYQRGIYPEEDFEVINKHNARVMTTVNKELEKYVADVMSQVKDWILENVIQKLVLLIQSVETGETVERWQFDIKAKNSNEDGQLISLAKESEKFDREFRATIRQITASVSFLPELTEKCTINIQVYTDKSVLGNEKWGTGDVALIKGGGEHMRLKTLSTSAHQVETFVAYQLKDNY